MAFYRVQFPIRSGRVTLDNFTMATATHATSPPYSSLSISHNSTDSTMNALQLPQPTSSAYEAAATATSTQTTTSPGSRGRQHILPLNMASFASTNGHPVQSTTSRALKDMAGHIAHQMYTSSQKPQIYSVCGPQAIVVQSMLTSHPP